MKVAFFAVASLMMCACQTGTAPDAPAKNNDTLMPIVDHTKEQFDSLSRQSDSLRELWMQAADSAITVLQLQRDNEDNAAAAKYRRIASGLLNRQVILMEHRKRIAAQIDSISKLQ